LGVTLKQAQAFEAMRNLKTDARRTTWRDIQIINRERLKEAIIRKYGSLTKAAEVLSIDYILLIHLLSGRRQQFESIRTIQADLELSDEQVLKLWPLLKTWPKESRIIA
jgi:hypothetical protein